MKRLIFFISMILFSVIAIGQNIQSVKNLQDSLSNKYTKPQIELKLLGKLDKDSALIKYATKDENALKLDQDFADAKYVAKDSTVQGSTLYYTKPQIDSIVSSLFTGYNNFTGYRVRVAVKDSVLIPNWSGLKTGMVASYSFDETSGTVATNYIQGGVANGVIEGATVNQTGVIGKCYSFDGSTGYVTIADHDNLDLTDSWSIALWINAPIPPMGNRLILDKQSYGFGFNNNVSDNIYFTSQARSWVNSFTNNTWYSLVFVNDNGQLTCYINGVSKGAVTVTNPTSNTNQLTIGALYWTGGDRWLGKIDELHIWKDRKLSQADVELMFELESNSKNVSQW